MNILLLSDIHANYPALMSTIKYLENHRIDLIINCGDSLVYGPFPNETLRWLRKNQAHSILGNTDKKVLKLLRGKTIKKPSKEEKRIMYTWTASVLKPKNIKYLKSLQNSTTIRLNTDHPGDSPHQLSIFHGSPARDHEFLFADTPDSRFRELAAISPSSLVTVGHSHTPFHKFIGNTHFINPGSIGRMFDGNPQVSFALLRLTSTIIRVEHFRIPYNIEEVTQELRRHGLPEIYNQMYLEGKKLN